MNSSNSSLNNSQKQIPTTEKPSKSPSFLGRFPPAFLIIVSLVLVLLLILICLLITQHSRKKPKKIQRQAVIVKKHSESTVNDPYPTLLEPYPGKAIDNIRVVADMLISDPDRQRNITDFSSDASKHSSISIKNNPLNETNDRDDLSDLDLTNVPVPRLPTSNRNLTDPSSRQTIKRSSYSSSDNLYVAEFKEKALIAKQPRASTGSKTSEESCL